MATASFTTIFSTRANRPKRGGRKRAVGTRMPMTIPAGAEPAMVARLYVGRAGRRAEVPGFERY